MQPPDRKRQKYDRQLRQVLFLLRDTSTEGLNRLWESHGQQALEEASICLLNGTATGTELLKNLILPGIGSFTVVDEGRVEESDVQSNFFVTRKALGEFRAPVVTELLKDLNEDVQGHYVVQSVEELVHCQPSFFKDFDMVIATQMNDAATVLALEAYCRSQSIPLLLAWSYGFIGLLRLCSPPLHLIETHVEQVEDLRLDCPWPDLIAHCDQYPPLEQMDPMALTHTPFPILLLKCLAEWKQAHQGLAPQDRSEREAFKAMMLQKAPVADEENFMEACSALYRACTVYTLPVHVEQVLKDPQCDHMTSESQPFWIMAHALKAFLKDEGRLPLSGRLPDMKADTQNYLALQQVYQRKSSDDCLNMLQRVHAVLSGVGLAKEWIPEDQVRLFCKHASELRRIAWSSLSNEWSLTLASSSSMMTKESAEEETTAKGAAGEKEKVKEAIRIGLEQEDRHMYWYLCLQASWQFYHEFKRFPGACEEDQLLKDQAELKRILDEWFSSANVMQRVPDAYLQETVRAGGCILHNIAAMVGGMGAQECLKWITQQYVPASGTIVLDAMKSTTSTVFVLSQD